MAPYRSEAFEVCLKPLIATARNHETLEHRQEIARQRLAFYCSTPAYANAFSIFGLEDLCAKLTLLSKQQKWEEMAGSIDDDLLNRFVVVALYDDLAATIENRYADCIDRIEVGFPVQTAEDRQALTQVIRQLRQ